MYLHLLYILSLYLRLNHHLHKHRWQPTRLPRPWDSPGKNTGVGCHFLLQCMKVKSESEVSQSCPTLSNPMDCSLRGSSVHRIFQARVLEWGAIAFSTVEYYPATKMNKILSGGDGIQVNKNIPAQGIIIIRRWILKDEDRKI